MISLILDKRLQRKIIVKILIIEASTRKNAGTQGHIDALIKANPKLSFEEISLLTEKLAPFVDQRSQNSWEYATPTLPLLEKMLASDLIVIATPVYWFSMSHLCKNFFDYWTFFMRAGKTPDSYFLKDKKVFTLLCAGHKEGSEWALGSIRESVKYVKGTVIKEFIGLSDREGNPNKNTLEEISQINLEQVLN